MMIMIFNKTSYGIIRVWFTWNICAIRKCSPFTLSAIVKSLKLWLLFIWNPEEKQLCCFTKPFNGHKSFSQSVKVVNRSSFHVGKKNDTYLSETKSWHFNHFDRWRGSERERAKKRNNFHNCYLLIYEHFPRHKHSFRCVHINAECVCVCVGRGTWTLFENWFYPCSRQASWSEVSRKLYINHAQFSYRKQFSRPPSTTAATDTRLCPFKSECDVKCRNGPKEIGKKP